MGAYPASRTQQLQHQHTQPLVQLLIDSVLDTWDPPYNMRCREKPIACSGDMIVCLSILSQELFCVAARATTLTGEEKRTAVFTRLTAAYKQFSEVSRPGLKNSTIWQKEHEP